MEVARNNTKTKQASKQNKKDHMNKPLSCKNVLQ